jgi:hypothetical protein
MLVALAALVLAAGGTSYAAFKLPRNSVTTSSIRKGAVTSSKVRDGTLRGRDFASGTLLTGPRGSVGPQGPQGPQGPAGDAPKIAYAHIHGTSPATTPDGFTLTQAKGITSANVIQESPSIYCFKNLSFQPENVQVTTDTTVVLGTPTSGFAEAHVAAPFDHCTGSSIQAEVFLIDPNTSDDVWELGFYVTFLG